MELRGSRRCRAPFTLCFWEALGQRQTQAQRRCLQERLESHHTEQLLPDTRDLIGKVEALTGKPVVLEPDPAIAGRARGRVKLAHSEAVAHVITYDPKLVMFLNHIVAHECGHLLRMWAVPPVERRLAMTTAEHRRNAAMQTEKELVQLAQKGLAPEGLGQLFPMWHQGLVIQLANTPADIHIERWLREEFPGLRREQGKALWSTMKDYRRILHPDVRKWTPPTVYEASVAMNYAYTEAIAGGFDDRRMLRPYSGRGEAVLGKRLYEIIEAAGDMGHNGDCLVSDQWAEAMGLKGWYAWVRAAEAPGSLIL